MTALVLAASAALSAVWPLFDIIDPQRAHHHYSVWFAATQIAVAPLLVIYVLVTVQLLVAIENGASDRTVQHGDHRGDD